MALYRDTGVVLRTYKFGEADRIVVLLTAERGKVRAVAKGVRKTKSRFGGRLEPLCHLNLLMYEGRNLDVVSQVETIDSPAPLLSDLDRLTQGLAIVEVVDQIAMDREPAPALYKMLVGALRTLEAKPSPIVVPAFFWKVLAIEGVRPQLDACVGCNGIEPEVVLVAFDFNEGGVQCRSCRRGRTVSSEALRVTRMILGGQLSAALEEPPSSVTAEVGHLATAALEHHLEKRLRAVAMFERELGRDDPMAQSPTPSVFSAALVVPASPAAPDTSSPHPVMLE